LRSRQSQPWQTAATAKEVVPAALHGAFSLFHHLLIYFAAAIAQNASDRKPAMNRLCIAAR